MFYFKAKRGAKNVTLIRFGPALWVCRSERVLGTIEAGSVNKNQADSRKSHITMQTLPLSLTEQRNPASQNLDQMSIAAIVDLIHQEDYQVLTAVAQAKPQITQAIEQIVPQLQSGGRLFYVGAGTSGRLGVLDATECPPTYSAPPEMVQAIIAGGAAAMVKAVEGAEDREDVASDLEPHHLSKNDVMVGIAASGTTPYVRAALRYAHQRNCRTILLCCNPVIQDDPAVDTYIVLPVGPEVVSGSTRMKAGTATKLVLNMLSTVSMIQLGKVYDNLMVDMTISNQKLQRRAVRILLQLTELNETDASQLLAAAHGEVKTALAMHHRQLDYAAAKALLSKYQGHLRRALNAT